jgi:hypothetical protein
MGRETITAAVTALADGKIKPSEMPIATGERQRKDVIRAAPSFVAGQFHRWRCSASGCLHN